MPEVFKELEMGKEVETKPLKRIIATFRRHFDPKKDPETMRSLDELSEKGIEQAKEVGGVLRVPGSGVAGRYSPKERAKQSAELLLEAAGQKDKFVALERKALDVINLGASPQASAEFSRIAKEQGFDASIQYILDTPLLSEQRQQITRGISHLVDRYIRMLDKVREGTDLAIENITHGPNLEIFLREALINSEGKRGFNKLEEIGGAFKPGEEFALNVEQLTDGTKKASINLRGEDYQLDLARVRELAGEYRKSQV
jgi:hypothetical protein